VTKPLAILSAIPEEIQSLFAEMRSTQITRIAMREYHRGDLWGRNCVVVYSRIGKVAAASTVTELLSRFGAGEVLFSGVAGGVRKGLRVGDIVIADRLVQHDLDARPLFPHHEIPLLGVSEVTANSEITMHLRKAAENFLADDLPKGLQEFGISAPRVHLGEIATGDQFFSSSGQIERLRGDRPHALCVEMEGASVAQVCHEHGVPFGVLRTLSDTADESAAVNFSRFIEKVATVYSHGILKRYLTRT
jgi:adenosylhomocysteine nucleosidase